MTILKRVVGKTSLMLAALSTAVCVLTYTADAQDITAEHLGAARDAMVASRSTTIFDTILPDMVAETTALFTRSNPALAPLIEEVTLKVGLEFAQDRPLLDQRMARIWAERFTQEELEAISEFLTSDIGEKFARLSPEIAQLQASTARAWIDELSTRFVTRVRDEMAERGHQL